MEEEVLVVSLVALVHCLLVVEHVPQEDPLAVKCHPLSDLSEVLDLQLKQVPILLVVVRLMELEQVVRQELQELH